MSAADATADYNVARALTLGQTIIDAGSRGITKEQLRDRMQEYRNRPEPSFERMFSRDKGVLREAGMPIREPDDDAEHHRYVVEKADYGLPDLRLTPAEQLALHRAQLFFANTTVRGLSHALWAVGAEDVSAEDGQTPLALYSSIGSDAEVGRLLSLTAMGLRQPVRFDYTRRGRLAPDTRRVITLGLGARGHWYLVGHDLDRDQLRTYRLDRISGHITPLADAAATAALENIETSGRYAGLDIQQVIAETGNRTPLRRALLEDVITAHTGPPPLPRRMYPVRWRGAEDPAEAKVDRVINMTAYLLSSDGAAPSRLMDKYGMGPEQLQRDLLSIQMTGTVHSDQFIQYISVRPEPPIEVAAFREEYLAQDALITLEFPTAAEELLSRPLGLTKPGALGLMIALKAVTEVCQPGEEGIAAAAETLRKKIADVVPAGMREAAEAMALSRTPADADRLSAASRAAAARHCVELDYEDADGQRTQRVVEPVQVVHRGPNSYLRAWCRRARDERFFKITRIVDLTPLPEEPQGPEAAGLELSDVQPPQVPRTGESVDVTLRFAPPAAGLVEQFAPEKQSEQEGAKIIRTHYRSEEAVIRRCLSEGGDIELLAPEHLRAEIRRRAQAELSRAVAPGP